MNQQAVIARIERQQAAVRAFVAEQHKLIADQNKTLHAAFISPWQTLLMGMTAGAALFGAGAAFIKIVSP
ncbi:hypothetical protein ACJMQP_25670 [Rhodopseudomonas palustris]